MSDNKKPDYFGTVFYNEYEGAFTGYTLLLSASQLDDAKQFLGENGRVRINIRNGKLDPKKPYSTITPDKSTYNANAQGKTYTKAPAPRAEANDLPF
jgi:hypothetical protein